jgi:site-specific DNA-methyltransferase (adenine-specific)
MIKSTEHIMKPNSNSSAGNGTNTPVVGSTVILGDCVEVMKGFEDNQFDLAIVDPPYELNGWHDKGNNRNRQSAKEGSKRKQWDRMPDEKYFLELKRISKNQIIWGGNYFLDYLGKCVAPVIWDKVNGSTHFADGEMAWTSFETGTLRIFKKHLSSTELNKSRMHPTQKPIYLYSWLLKKFATEGMKILDTHLGSGSSRIAADKAGLDFTGIEIDKEYFDLSEKRFKQYKSQLRIEGW